MTAGALFVATPALSAAPTPLPAPSSIVEVQFRFPWEARPAKRIKRPNRQSRPAAKRPDKTERARRSQERLPERKVPAARSGPMGAALPALAVPLAIAAPLGRTQREADDWALVASQVPPPQDPPLISPDGPGPLSASTLAALASLKPAEPIETARLSPESDEGETEAPDLHVPMPPVRPAGPGEPETAETGPDGVPLPPKRPGDMAALEPGEPPKPTGPTLPDIDLPVTSHADDPDCAALKSTGFAEAEEIPPIEGPGVCGGGPLVLLSGVKRKDGATVKIRPAATLRCSMAREVADFLRDDVAPAVEKAGGALTRLDVAGSFQCRGRNGAAGGKMSEHGRANALDLSGFAFEDGRAFGIFATDLPGGLSAAVKSAACGRFSTVLGPGSDGFHEDHLHVDLQPRRSKSKLCQWADPEVAKAEEKERDSAPGKTEDAKAGEPKKDDKKPDDKAAATSGDKDEPKKSRDADKPAETSKRADRREREARGERSSAPRKAAERREPLPKRERTP